MTIENIQNHATYKKVLADSFGGVMYDVANQGKYETGDVAYLIQTWSELTESQRGVAGGIMKDAINFLKGE